MTVGNLELARSALARLQVGTLQLRRLQISLPRLGDRVVKTLWGEGEAVNDRKSFISMYWGVKSAALGQSPCNIACSFSDRFDELRYRLNTFRG